MWILSILKYWGARYWTSMIGLMRGVPVMGVTLEQVCRARCVRIWVAMGCWC